MQIVFQDPFGALSPRMSVGDIVAEGLSVHQPGLSEAEREARVVKALQDVGMDPATRFRYPHEFSGGQRQRISIARAAVLEPNFVVLDEPTSALDMLFQAQMVDLLRELQRKRDLTYMFISHDLRVVASLASHLIVMRHGKVVEEGPASELFQSSEDRLHPRAVRRGVPAGSRAGWGGGDVVDEIWRLVPGLEALRFLCCGAKFGTHRHYALQPMPVPRCVLRITRENFMMRLARENIRVFPIMQTIAVVPGRKIMAKVACAIEAKAVGTSVTEESTIAAGPKTT